MRIFYNLLIDLHFERFYKDIRTNQNLASWIFQFENQKTAFKPVVFRGFIPILN